MSHSSSPPPLIAVSGRRRSAAGAHDGPAALDRLQVEVYFAGYADRLVEAGGLPVHLPSRVDPVAAMAHVHGLVLSGGTDVDPRLYGAVTRDTTPPVDPVRDAFELRLLAAALERDLPVLAICRGLQLLNISRGGTLHAHLTDHPVGAGRAHDVHLVEGGLAAQLYGPVVPVNSLHHQAVAEVGEGLVVTGCAPDGVAEVLELPGRDVVAVQWHPEQLPTREPVFDWLISAARRRALGRHGVEAASVRAAVDDCWIRLREK